MNNKLRAIAIGAITAIAGIGVGAIGTEIASAHANQITGVSTCQTDGTYTVTWTVANNLVQPETVSLIGFAGGGSLSGLPADIAANDSTPYMTASVTQSGVPGAVTEATLTVHGWWAPDEYSHEDIGLVTLAGTCNQVTAGTIGYTEPTCANPTQAAVILPTNTPHVGYSTSPTPTVSTSVVTTASANSGWVLTGPSTFPHTFNAAPADCTILVTPVAPTVVTTTACGVKDTFSTNGPAGVIYTPASGLLNAGQTITVVATAASGYAITPGAQTTFTLTGGTVETCTTDTTAPAPTTTTVPAVVVEAPTTPTTPAAQIDAPVPVTAAPLAVGDTIAPAAPATGLPSTGTSSTLVLLLGGLLLAAGTGMLAVVRRRGLK